ncbi:hypothetical protein LVD17_14460 [Fulvivirga ulvae]|uniref:hypothetical protein n=1 Tax=Fulvivirga ulvae TaxID=2904245 RepID=UPI001F293BB8|nr:hypothetical protein [Fulvivirga ulvae]UII35009.1 hypothetical protein LVD17_14460 [Fulvivirga ulvae]
MKTIVAILILGTLGSSCYLHIKFSEMQAELISSKTKSYILEKEITSLREEIKNKTYFDFNNNELVVDKVISKSLEIRDNNERTRYLIKSGADSEIFERYYDNAMVERLQLGITSNGTSRVRLFDELGNKRISSSVLRTDTENSFVATTHYFPDEDPAHSTTVTNEYAITNVYDLHGKIRLRSGTINGFGFNGFYDNAGKIRLELNTSPDSNANILFSDSNKNQRMRLAQMSTGETGIYLLDNYGKYRQGFGINTNDVAFIESVNSNNKVMFGSHTYSNGKNKTYIYKSPGKNLWDLWSDVLTARASLRLLK